MYNKVNLGHCAHKFIDTSVYNLLKECVDVLDETRIIKEEFLKEYGFPDL